MTTPNVKETQITREGSRVVSSLPPIPRIVPGTDGRKRV
jgi:hypothetical protein